MALPNPGRAAFSIAAFTALCLTFGVLRAGAEGVRPGCPDDARRDALRAVQTHVLRFAPARVDSFDAAMRPGGPLAGWKLSHGYVVLEGSGAITLHNPARRFPDPQALLYAPAPSSTAADWLDFNGADGPYRLVGWAYSSPYRDGAKAPVLLPCITSGEWVVHEAGWHLLDGGMRLTPGFEQEPARPRTGPGVYFWHPRHWDIRFWRGADGAPTVGFHNPDARMGGMRLPRGSFFYIIDGRPWPEPEEQKANVPVRWQP